MQEVKKPESKGPGLRVLIVDDDEDTAYLLCEWLEHEGFDVRAARDGASALELAGRFLPHAMLLDIGLPGMTGHELAYALQERLPETRILAVTGYDRDLETHEQTAFPFQERLVKPIDLQKLGAILRSMR